MFGVLATSNTLYVAISSINPVASWALTPAAIFLGASPLLVALWVVRKFNRRLRWLVVSLYAALSIFVLLIQHRAADGPELALNAVLFTVYFGCCLHFWYGYRRGTTGAFITIAGFLAWSLVFVAAPIMEIHFPAVHIESEVWNLPKYVVAVGMILLLLEDQIEYNRHLALHDHLTGLPNRRLFQDRLASALERARRTETRTALLIVDLDRFKQVNDTFGHHAGDLVLQQVAAKFSARVRRSDTVARTGGDEFSVILEEPTSREQAVVVGMSLMQLLNEPLKVNPDQSACIGASVGVAIFPEDAHDMESLCIAADRRMYAFKHDSEEPIVKEVFVGPTPLAAFKPQSHRPVTVADQFGVVRGKL
jgi:diguanylate cyclase (GGDEF)-like protein